MSAFFGDSDCESLAAGAAKIKNGAIKQTAATFTRKIESRPNTDHCKVEMATTNAVFTILMAALIAIAIKMVGILLITGMLIIPAAMARNISSSPQMMVIYSVIGGLLSVILGLLTSLEFNTASGPSIIVASLFLFILSLLKIKQSVKLKN